MSSFSAHNSNLAVQTTDTFRGVGLKALVRSLKDDTEAREIERPLDQTNWNRRAAAAQLNLSYKALLYKIKQHGLSPTAGHGGFYAEEPVSSDHWDHSDNPARFRLE